MKIIYNTMGMQKYSRHPTGIMVRLLFRPADGFYLTAYPIQRLPGGAIGTLYSRDYFECYYPETVLLFQSKRSTQKKTEQAEKLALEKAKETAEKYIARVNRIGKIRVNIVAEEVWKEDEE